MSRQSAQYLNCMAAKLPLCLQGFCPDGTVCTYQQCWAQADTACFIDSATPSELPPAGQLPPPPPSVPETQGNLDVIGLIYAAAQAAAGVLPAGATPANIDPSLIPPQLPPLIPALQGTLPVLSQLGIDPGAVLQDLLGYHAAVQRKKQIGSSTPVTWDEINQGLGETPPAATPPTTTAPKKKETNWVLWLGVGAVAAAGIYYATQD